MEELTRSVFSNFQWISSRGVKRGFTHRFVKIEDLINLFRIFRRIISKYSSLRNIVKDVYESSSHLEEPMEAVILGLIKVFYKHGGRPPLIPIRFSSSFKRLKPLYEVDG